MSEHMFFQGNPSGKADDAPSELSTLSVLCELLGKVDALERRIARLEAENAKLRELVRIAGTYCAYGLCGKDDGCPLYLGKPYCALPDSMRELGVEV